MATDHDAPLDPAHAPRPRPDVAAQLARLDAEAARGTVSVSDYWHRRWSIETGAGDPRGEPAPLLTVPPTTGGPYAVQSPGALASGEVPHAAPNGVAPAHASTLAATAAAAPAPAPAPAHAGPAPRAGHPGAGQPEAGQPEAGQPEPAHPEARQPEPAPPGTPRPEATQPGTPRPEATQPEPAPPGTPRPEATQPEPAPPETPHHPEATQPEPAPPETPHPEGGQDASVATDAEATQSEPAEPVGAPRAAAAEDTPVGLAPPERRAALWPAPRPQRVQSARGPAPQPTTGHALQWPTRPWAGEPTLPAPPDSDQPEQRPAAEPVARLAADGAAAVAPNADDEAALPESEPPAIIDRMLGPLPPRAPRAAPRDGLPTGEHRTADVQSAQPPGSETVAHPEQLPPDSAAAGPSGLGLPAASTPQEAVGAPPTQPWKATESADHGRPRPPHREARTTSDPPSQHPVGVEPAPGDPGASWPAQTPPHDQAAPHDIASGSGSPDQPAPRLWGRVRRATPPRPPSTPRPPQTDLDPAAARLAARMAPPPATAPQPPLTGPGGPSSWPQATPRPPVEARFDEGPPATPSPMVGPPPAPVSRVGRDPASQPLVGDPSALHPGGASAAPRWDPAQGPGPAPGRHDPFTPPAGAVEVHGVDLSDVPPPPVRRPRPQDRSRKKKRRRWFI